MQRSLSLLLCLLPLTCGRAQSTLAETLGYPAGTKLLIVHADDLGVTHATNAASIAALEQGSVSSASVMANCPWLPEIAEWARTNPDHDLGMHLTLTSEWRKLRWGTVAPAGAVSSLTDSSGYLYPNCQYVWARADPEEVRTEIRAQIERARSLGLDPTHLDTHMGCLVFNPRLLKVYLEVGRQYGIPAMVSHNELRNAGEEYTRHLQPSDLVVDYIHSASYGDYDRGLDNYYRELLADLQPGVSVLLIHTALDGAESAAMAGGVAGWGNRWRQQDYNFFTSDALPELLKEYGIQLISWRQLSRQWQARR